MDKNDDEVKSVVELAGEDLFNFATDREDVKTLVRLLPPETKCRPEAVEYELQLLKIISTGWALSFFIENSGDRDRLADIFWKATFDFSGTLSETANLMAGQEIDYFQVLRERLDMYVKAMERNPESTEPAAVIGPEFAGVCGSPDDIYAVMAGSRMFIMTVASVKEYLESVGLQ